MNEHYETQAEYDRDLSIERLGGLKAYEQFTLERFANKSVIALCKDFPDCNLFVFGPAGTGKTHLATALVRSNPYTIIWKPQEIYRKFRGLDGSEQEEKLLGKFIHSDQIVIDDLGVDKRTDFSFSILYEIIEGRDMALKNGMIVTSNLSLSALAERLGGDQIISRLAGMCKIIELSGNDWRLKK